MYTHNLSRQLSGAVPRKSSATHHRQSVTQALANADNKSHTSGNDPHHCSIPADGLALHCVCNGLGGVREKWRIFLIWWSASEYRAARFHQLEHLSTYETFMPHTYTQTHFEHRWNYRTNKLWMVDNTHYE